MKLSISYFILATLAKCQVAEAQTCEDNIVVLGDSYSDTGNLFSLSLGEFPPQDAYRDVENNPGRFTNGRVWIEYLADLMKLNQPNAFYDNGEGTNYAIGGAASGSATSTEWSPNLPGAPLKVQANGLILQTEDVVSKTSRKCRRETLFAIWIGAVDLLMLGETKFMNIVNNIETSIRSLINGGATKFIVMNLPQLAGAPVYVDAGSSLFLSQEIPTDLEDDITGFNKALADMLKIIDMSNDVTITHVDIGPLISEVAGDPKRFGLEGDVSTPILNEVAFHTGQDEYIQNEQNALWYDGVHPSTTFHELLAKEVYRVVTCESDGSVTSLKSLKCPKGTKAPKATKAPKSSKSE
mmetsp:Transcript_16450/g.19510  ORF Transcript_16450/g.19510 Transcript_16450/m.19510 type:complete len:353 (-) Transcript_16450:254-1312(-)